MHVAGEGQQLLRLHHVHGLFAHRVRRLPQVKLFGHGDHEHVVLSGFSHGDERLEHACGIKPQQAGHLYARKRLLAGERAGLVGDARCVQDAHGVGLAFVGLSHGGLLSQGGQRADALLPDSNAEDGACAILAACLRIHGTIPPFLQAPVGTHAQGRRPLARARLSTTRLSACSIRASAG